MFGKKGIDILIAVGIAAFFIFGIPYHSWESDSGHTEAQVPATEETVDDTAGWKQDYYNFITTDSEVSSWIPAQDEWLTCSVIYVDGDAVPEIYLQGGYTASGDLLLTWYNGTVKHYYITNYGGVYAEKTGIFGDFNGRMGGYWNQVYKLENGELTLTADGCFGEECIYDEISGEETWVNSNFMWNNQSVTEEEYFQLLDQAVEGNEIRACTEGMIYDGTYADLIGYLGY